MGDLLFGYCHPRVNIMIQLSDKNNGNLDQQKLPAALRELINKKKDY